MFVVKLYGFGLSIAYIVRRHHPYIESHRLSDDMPPYYLHIVHAVDQIVLSGSSSLEATGVEHR